MATGVLHPSIFQTLDCTIVIVIVIWFDAVPCRLPHYHADASQSYSGDSRILELIPHTIGRRTDREYILHTKEASVVIVINMNNLVTRNS